MANKNKPVDLSEYTPIFEDGEVGITNFESTIVVTEGEGEPSDVTVLGTAAITPDGGRFIYFEPLAPGDTAIGMLQRELAKQNKMFIVDQVKIDKLWAEIGQQAAEAEVAEIEEGEVVESPKEEASTNEK